MNSGLYQNYKAGKDYIKTINRIGSLPYQNYMSYTGFGISNTYTFKVPENVYSALVVICGGGGRNTTAGDIRTGGGGGALVIAEVYVSPNENIRIIAGGYGGTSTFGNYITCTGGSNGDSVSSTTGVSHTLYGGSGGQYYIDKTKIKKLILANNGGKGGDAIGIMRVSASGSFTIQTGGGGCGGNGGSVSSITNSATSVARDITIYTGGGGIFGNGGSVSNISTTTQSITIQTGGGGLYGNGSGTSNIHNTTTNLALAGGGAYGNAVSTTAGDKNIYDYERKEALFTAGVSGVPTSLLNTLLDVVSNKTVIYGSGEDASSTFSKFGGGGMGGGSTGSGFGAGSCGSGTAGYFGGAGKNGVASFGSGAMTGTQSNGIVMVFY